MTTPQTGAGEAVSRPVLVVDDEPGVRQFVQRTLESSGLTVVTAASGREALQIAARQRPALVVLDINLPDLDGVGIAAALWGAYGKGLPIVVMSGVVADQEANRIGAIASLHKPFGATQLISVVLRALNRT